MNRSFCASFPIPRVMTVFFHGEGLKFEPPCMNESFLGTFRIILPNSLLSHSLHYHTLMEPYLCDKGLPGFANRPAPRPSFHLVSRPTDDVKIDLPMAIIVAVAFTNDFQDYVEHRDKAFFRTRDHFSDYAEAKARDPSRTK